MEENQNTQNDNPQQEQTQAEVHTEPVQTKKKANAGLILGIIGTTTGTLALLIVILMGIAGIGARANLRDNLQDRREQIIENRQNQPGMRGAFQNDDRTTCPNCQIDNQ